LPYAGLKHSFFKAGDYCLELQKFWLIIINTKE